MQRYQTIKVWQMTLLKLRMLSALKKESIVQTLDALLGAALEAENVYFEAAPPRKLLNNKFGKAE